MFLTKSSKYFQNENQISHFKIKLICVLINTFLLIFFTIALQYINIIRFDETEFFKIFALTKHNILQIDKKPLEGNVIFLDVSKDLQITDDTAANYGKVSITDRKLLNEFFTKLNEYPSNYKYVVCDISFDFPSENDSALKFNIEKTKNLIVAASIKNHVLLKPLFNVTYGCADYTVNSGSFVKIPLFYDDTIKSLPVKLTEMTSSNTFMHNHGRTYENNRFTFNTILPEFYYRKKDLVSSDQTNGKPNLFYLGELMTIPDYFNKFLRNKYIVLGDFTNDVHNTYLGLMPGSLILLNTFLSLKASSIAISWLWIFLLFLVFFAISYFIFMHPQQKLEQFHSKIRVPIFKKFIKRYISYLGILVIVNIISYIFFGVFISLFYLATYLTFLELLIDKRKQLLESKNLVTFIKNIF